LESYNFTLTFSRLNKDEISLNIQKGEEKVNAHFTIETELLSYGNNASFMDILVQNQVQVQKVISSALKSKSIQISPITFVIIPNFPFLNHHDYLQVICIDQRGESPLIYSQKEGVPQIPKIFCDGSYAYANRRSGFAGVIELANGSNEIYSATIDEKSNNYIELLAVIEGLKRLKSEEKIQINTDSRFVIRGLSQWIYFWKYNHWQTAFSTEVKFIELWQELDQLCQHKYIELKWIKGHSGNEYQDFCHCMAKALSTSQKQ